MVCLEAVAVVVEEGEVIDEDTIVFDNGEVSGAADGAAGSDWVIEDILVVDGAADGPAGSDSVIGARKEVENGIPELALIDIEIGWLDSLRGVALVIENGCMGDWLKCGRPSWGDMESVDKRFVICVGCGVAVIDIESSRINGAPTGESVIESNSHKSSLIAGRGPSCFGGLTLKGWSWDRPVPNWDISEA